MPAKRQAAKGRRANGDGQISRDGNGYKARIVVGFDPATGKPRFKAKRTRTHEEAAEALRKMQAEMLAGKLAPSACRSLGEYLALWLEKTVKPTCEPATCRQYEYIVRLHILPHLGKKRLDKVTRADIQSLIAAKAKQDVMPKAPGRNPQKKLSRRVLELIRNTLRNAYNRAIEDGFVLSNPAVHVVLPKSQQKPVPALTPEEAARLMQAADKSDMPVLWRFFLTTGCRLGEATGVRWQDIDLENGMVTFCGQLRPQEGALVWVGKTKTNQIRRVALGKRLAQELKDLRAQQLVEGLSDPDGLVFLNVYGNRLSPKFVWNRLAKLAKEAGIPKLHPHMLRHTAATLAQMATGDIHATQTFLGHKSVSLTANLYAKPVDQKKKDLARRLEQILENRQPGLD